MAARTKTRDGAPPPTDVPPAPPLAPPDPPPAIDEGPMRRELLRQIALLDADLGARTTHAPPGRTTDCRGPALLPTVQLERIRDELLAALRVPPAAP
jgi:hypothetical protein